MFGFIAPIVGTVARLPRVVKAAGVAYAAGAVVSATKSIVNGDSAGTVAKRAAQSWFGMSRSTSTSKKSSKKGKKSSHSTKKHKKIARVKRAANRLKANPTPENLKTALATAQAEGISVPAAITAAVNKL